MRILHRHAVTALLAAVLVAASGCAAQRRPTPPRSPAPNASEAHPPGHTQGRLGLGEPDEGDVRYPTPRAGAGYDSPSVGVGIVASAVPGAGAVSAVVLGNVALLGIPSQDPAVHRKVAEQIHSSFAHIVEVRVATDAATISRLAQISDRIRAQRSVAQFLPELTTMSARMTGYR